MSRSGTVGYSRFVVSPCDEQDEEGNHKRTWDVMRAGATFASCTTREEAEQERDRLDAQENLLWEMTPEYRVAILKDREHELHDIASFLNGKFTNFRTYRQRQRDG